MKKKSISRILCLIVCITMVLSQAGIYALAEETVVSGQESTQELTDITPDKAAGTESGAGQEETKETAEVVSEETKETAEAVSGETKETVEVVSEETKETAEVVSEETKETAEVGSEETSEESPEVVSDDEETPGEEPAEDEEVAEEEPENTLPTTGEALADKTVYTSNDSFIVTDKDDWKAFADLVKSGKNFAGKTVTLKLKEGNVLDLTELGLDAMVGQEKVLNMTAKRSSTDIKNAGSSFNGTFDGNNCTIKVNINLECELAAGAQITVGYACVGLFEEVSGATIRNFTVEGKIATDGSFGSAAVCGRIITNGKNTFENIINKAEITSSRYYASGIVYAYSTAANPAIYPDVTIIDCGNEGKITGTYACGITYYNANPAKAPFIATGCYNTGELAGTSTSYGIAYAVVSTTKGCWSVGGYDLGRASGPEACYTDFAGTTGAIYAADMNTYPVIWSMNRAIGKTRWAKADSGVIPVPAGEGAMEINRIAYSKLDEESTADITVTPAVSDSILEETQDGVKAYYGGNSMAGTLTFEMAGDNADDLDFEIMTTGHASCELASSEVKDGVITKVFNVNTQSGDVALRYGTKTEKEATLTTAWYDANPSATSYVIKTPGELLGFSQLVTGGKESFEGKTVFLGNDINMPEGKAWTPAGNSTTVTFKGTFDGQNYTITGLNNDPAIVKNVGLFGHVTGGTIRNVTVKGGTFKGTGTYVAGIAAQLAAGSTVENCISEQTIESTGNYAAGIAGYATGATIKNCENRGSITGAQYAAGVVATMLNGSYVENCINRGNVSGTTNYVAGIAGNTQKSSMAGCENHGDVTAKPTSATAYIGGIAGGVNAGTLANAVNITSCLNTGNISSSTNRGYVGGIAAGYTSAGFCVIDNCMNTGTVSSAANYFGGIMANIGGTTTAQQATIRNCVNYADVPFTVAKSTAAKNNGESEERFVNCFTSGPAFVKPFDNTVLVAQSSAEEFKAPDMVVALNKGFGSSFWGYDGSSSEYKYPIYKDYGEHAVYGIEVKPANDENTQEITIGDETVTGDYNLYGDKNISLSLKGDENTLFMISQEGQAIVTVKSECEVKVLMADGTAASITVYYGTEEEINNLVTTGWYNDNDTVFVITTPGQLAGLIELVNTNAADFLGKTVQLGNDINLSGIFGEELGSWTPVGTVDYPFRGTFDGNGNTVSGLYIDDKTDVNVGFFGVMEAPTVKNLTIEGKVSSASTAANTATGALAGRINGAVGRATVIENITNKAEVKSAGYFVGGIAGYVYATTSIAPDKAALQCEFTASGLANKGTVTNTATSKTAVANLGDGRTYVTNQVGAGGLFGRIDAGAKDTSYVKNSYNTGNVTANTADPFSFAGGIVGNLYTYDGYSARDDYRTNVKNCYNTGKIEAGYAGGIIGDIGLKRTQSGTNAAMRAEVAYNYNAGTVYGRTFTAGIAHFEPTLNNFAGATAGSSAMFDPSNDTTVAGNVKNNVYKEGVLFTYDSEAGTYVPCEEDDNTIGEKNKVMAGRDEIAQGKVAYLLDNGDAGAFRQKLWGQGINGPEFNAPLVYMSTLTVPSSDYEVKVQVEEGSAIKVLSSLVNEDSETGNAVIEYYFSIADAGSREISFMIETPSGMMVEKLEAESIYFEDEAAYEMEDEEITVDGALDHVNCTVSMTLPPYGVTIIVSGTEIPENYGEKMTLILDANGGFWKQLSQDDAVTKEIEVTIGDRYMDYPELEDVPQTNEEAVFGGWCLDKNLKEIITGEEPVTPDKPSDDTSDDAAVKTIYASWLSGDSLIKVTLNPMGGKFVNIEAENRTEEIQALNIKDTPFVTGTQYLPSRAGYEFTGWSFSDDGGFDYKDEKLTEDTVLYAAWQKKTSLNVSENEIKGSVIGNAEQISITENDITKILGNEAMTGLDEIVINNTVEASAQKLNIILSKDAMNMLLEGSAANMTVNGSHSSLGLTWETIDGIQAEQQDTLTVSIESHAVTDSQLKELLGEDALIVEVTAKLENEEIHDLNGQYATIAVEVPASLEDKNVKAVYVEDNDIKETLQGEQKDGMYYFKTPHFSTFALVCEGSTSVPLPPAVGPEEAKVFTVTFDANGGIFDTSFGTSRTYAVKIKNGETVDRGIPVPIFNSSSSDMYKFTGWYSDKNGESKWSETAPVTENITVYAGWTVLGDIKELIENGGDSAADPVIIPDYATLRELQKYAAVTNLEGKYFKLGSDIKLVSGTWTSGIGGPNGFQGHFDGDGHTITYSNTPSLFASVGVNGTVDNVKVQGKCTGAGIANSLVTGGIISNCTVKSGSSTESGGIAGNMNSTNSGAVPATIEKCTVEDGVTVRGTDKVGGIVGSMTGNGVQSVIKDCKVGQATITGNGDYLASARSALGGLGGIVGYGGAIITNTSCNASIICTNTAPAAGIGGIIGTLGTTQGHATIDGCMFGGDISASTGSDYIGGIVGLATMTQSRTLVITNSFSTADFSSLTIDENSIHIGGIFGGEYTGGQATVIISNAFWFGETAETADEFSPITLNVNSAQRDGIIDGSCFYDKDAYGDRGDSEVGTAKTEKQFASGEITWFLNGNSSEGIWRQGDECPDFEGKKIYKVSIAPQGTITVTDAEGNKTDVEYEVSIENDNGYSETEEDSDNIYTFVKDGDKPVIIVSGLPEDNMIYEITIKDTVTGETVATTEGNGQADTITIKKNYVLDSEGDASEKPEEPPVIPPLPDEPTQPDEEIVDGTDSEDEDGYFTDIPDDAEDVPTGGEGDGNGQGTGEGDGKNPGAGSENGNGQNDVTGGKDHVTTGDDAVTNPSNTDGAGAHTDVAPSEVEMEEVYMSDDKTNVDEAVNEVEGVEEPQRIDQNEGGSEGNDNPEEQKEKTIFRVITDAVKENPLVTAAVVACMLGIIIFGALKRRKEDEEEQK